MARLLLETKFHVPQAHGPRVARERLSARIQHGAQAKLTLVSAPAGFGKTTLMAELATASAGSAPVAWLSLEPGDNDPVTFWTYVVGALDRVEPGLGRPARSILEGAQGSVDVALATLVNGLSALASDVVLVLDDYHVIEAPGIHEAVAWFVEHLPARVHVVIGTRADPPMPLARLRAKGQLVEIRAADLRFTIDEAVAYLNDGMGLSLRPEHVAALEARTEGWIAALQLAALSVQGREDVGSFIDSFAGDDRYIVDYLVEEVLRRQSEAIRSFLLRTSILSRMSGSLCEAVTGQDGGRATLEALDRGNLFLIPLDDQRRWYRYHHLFAGVLQAHLAEELPDEVPRLHRLASDWYEGAGDRPEAIRHALAANDAGRAAELVELALPEMRRTRQDQTVLRWLDSLPADVFPSRPVLSVGYAGSLLTASRIEGVEELLNGAEPLLAEPGAASEAGRMIVVDDAEFRRLPGAIELYRAAVAKMRGDLEGNLAHARRVLELVDDADHIGRGGAEAFLGLAYWGMGDLDAGYRAYTEGMASLEKAGNVTDLVGGAIVQADIRLAQGRLRDALRVYEEGLARATPAGEPLLRGATDMHTGISQIRYEQGDLADARRHLTAGRELGEELAFPRNPHRSRVVEARILQAEGDVDRAIALLDEAERLYLSDFSPDVRPVPAERARVQIAHGRTAEARRWASAHGLEALAPSYVREFELITFARLLVAEAADEPAAAKLAHAIELTDLLRVAAEDGGRNGSLIEIHIVGALARYAAGEAEPAADALAHAVALAEPEGWVRVFLDEGPAMRALLKAAAKRPSAPAYLSRLVGGPGAGAGAGPSTPHARQPLDEPLSERELEVLRMLQSDLDGPDLARELFVSLNTLRTHTKSIYAKLGVTSRRAAVSRAAELNLLSRSDSEPRR